MQMRCISVVRCHRLLFGILLTAAPACADLKALNEAYSAMNAGFAFSDADATRLESSVSSAADLRAHIALLAYYSVSCKSLPVESIKQRRAEHIGWLVEKAPTSELFNIANAIYQIFLTGDRLADPERFHQTAALWMKQAQLHPEDHAIQMNASRFLELGDLPAAAALLRRSGNTQAVGSMYSLLLLGVVARDYRTGESAIVDETVRSSGLAKAVLSELRQSSDAKLIGGAGYWTAVQGGMLYADGKMDWDYTPVSHELLHRALTLDPTTVQWYALVDQSLPKRGQRPARVFGTSAAALRSRRVRSILPIYPPKAKASGAEGKVTLNLLVGPDGRVVKAVITDGLAEFRESVLDAVKQWEYKPNSRFECAPAEIAFSLSGVVI